MYLQNIKLWNFRKYGSNEAFDLTSSNLNLNFTKGVNVLIGENDSGKTAIIDAIKLVLKTHSYEWMRIDKDDFYGNSDKFRIELLFKDLSIEEAKNFTEWLSWEGEGEDAVPTLKLVYEANIRSERIIPSDVKAGLSEEGYLLTSEAKEYLKVTYLKPLRDAKTELIPKKNSRLSQIFQEHEAFKGRDKGHPLKTIFEEFEERIGYYFEGREFEDQKGKELKKEIDGYLQSFYDATKETEIKVSEGKLKSILEKLELLVKDEINVGLGTLNRLFMASELLHLNKKDYDGLRLGLIEELEAHLHPQAQMQVIESLQKQKDIQLILTTHSPNLASKVELENIILCESNNAFPLGREYTKLDNNDYIFLEKFLDTTKANLFFAKGIIMVEGWAEEILLPSLAKSIGIDLTVKGVSVVNIGHTGFDHYSKIFLRNNTPDMSIPVAVITDSDVKEYEIINDEIQKRNSDTISLENEQKLTDLNGKSENNIQYFPAPNWTLEYSLLKSKFLNSSLIEVLKNVHSGTNWDEDSEKELAKKLLNKGLKKSDIAYKLADKAENSFCINKSNGALETDSINYLIKAIRYATRN
ncbi:AAA family ATPase [uncultured Winogradskyella sp.]|uniref:ATP-dependent nuclease n=1 Tax=uncultured Winogradskyella sp. TaxID=395353 RepID=UPI00260526C9|nr:AAA family ATPase [uncultured Winogradskyella sp.]